MTDLVEKLRRRAKQNPTPGGLLVMVDPGTLNEAADELERLASDLTRVHQEIRERHEALVKAVDTVMTLQAELAELRALVAEWEQVWAMVTPGDSDG